MTTTDRFEAYLEPLYTPGVLFFATWILSVSIRDVSFNFPNGHFYTDLVFVGLSLTVISSVIAALYEFLLVFKVVKSRCLLDGRTKIYSIIRWILGAAGIIAVAYSILLIVLGILALISGPFVSFHLS